MSGSDDNGEEDNNLSDHSRSMQKAFKYCMDLFNELPVLEDETIWVSEQCDHRERRNKAARNFWATVDASHTTSQPIVERFDVKLIHIDNDKVATDREQVWSFKDRFQNVNLPCLITGLDRLSHFDFVNQNWRSNNFDPNTGNSKVNRNWFLEELGSDFLVPLRYIPHTDFNNNDDDEEDNILLDEDGRALECETREVSMKEWIHLLDEDLPSSSNSLSENQSQISTNNSSGQVVEEEINDIATYGAKKKESVVYYLKDWHLQQLYKSSPLYSCPYFFGHDLLNSFLKKFTKGDYQFCYWGPARSYTAQHSDVLHSFSWSYNVVGSKEWTFYQDIHSINDDNNTNDEDNSNHNKNNCNDLDRTRYKTFTIRQMTGEIMFVPAMWQHRVVNMEETISINHNWITSSNLDLTWDCLRVEMIAVQKELKGWGGDDRLDQNMEACEKMLRGCLGLDVTAFVLMTLVRALEIITELLSLSNDHQERLVFDLFRLTTVLRDVLTTEPTLVQLRNRLKAILKKDEMVEKVEIVMKNVIDCVH
mmetsp:Transcript_45613/g.51456  ORF Transcript_45613/g.51456 Transcript_45613/m.51456 type:complete len:535 (-) Transcript_45613:160-1764(-)